MVKTLKEKDYLILLINTEGFGALDTDSNHDVRIFTLAILLSSYFFIILSEVLMKSLYKI